MKISLPILHYSHRTKPVFVALLALVAACVAIMQLVQVSFAEWSDCRYEGLLALMALFASGVVFSKEHDGIEQQISEVRMRVLGFAVVVALGTMIAFEFTRSLYPDLEYAGYFPVLLAFFGFYFVAYPLTLIRLRQTPASVYYYFFSAAALLAVWMATEV